MSSLDTAVADPRDGAPASEPTLLPRRAARANLVAVSAAHAVLHANVVLLPLIYPILRDQYHLSYTQIGLLVTIPNIVGGLLQVVFGYLGRYVSRKALIGIGNLLVGVSMFLTGVSGSYSGFLGWGVLRNIAGAPQHPVGSALLTDTFGRRRRGFALAAHVAGGNLGTLIVPFLGTALILYLGWQPALMLFALPGILAGTAVLIFTREPKGALPTKAAGTVAAGARPTRRLGTELRGAVAPLRRRGVLLIILASIIASGGRGVGVLTTYLPLYLRSDLGLAADVVAGLFTLLLAGSVVGPLVAGRLSDRAGRRPMLLLSYGFAAVFTTLLPLVGGTHAPFLTLVAVIALIGLFAYAESPLLQAYLADHVPDTEKDAAFGWYFTLAFGFGSLWGTLLGAVIDHSGFGAAFWVMAASYLLAAVILLRVPRLREF